MSVFIKKWFVLSCFVILIGSTLHAISPAEQAKSILKETNTQGGLVVHIGCHDGLFATALHADERYLVHALCTTRDDVKAVRARIKEKNLYGHVSAELWDTSRLPYADNLVNLLVVEPGVNLPKKELFRVLIPGGTLFFRGRDKGAKQVKPRPDSIDEWTHYLHDADNNAVAQDTRVMPPKHLQWKAGPMWCRSHEFASSITCMVSAKHRMYMIVDEGIIGQPRGVPPQ
ncbi:hypothetical protein GF373_08125, partial [bacterium]|nr:hypothetical protein [bacterium]